MNLIKFMWREGILGRAMLVYIGILTTTLVLTACEYVAEVSCR